jgi:hypothetical protein
MLTNNIIQVREKTRGVEFANIVEGIGGSDKILSNSSRTWHGREAR